VKDGLDIIGVPTSDASRKQAEALGIPLTTLEEHPFPALAVDGADELDDQLRLIKGGGGALLREKVVAAAADGMIVIADDSKRVATLGAFPLPIEVLPFGLETTRQLIEAVSADFDLTGSVSVRKNGSGQPFMTDSGNMIVDCGFSAIYEPEELAIMLSAIPGVVEHGLFIGLADIAIVAGDEGTTVLEFIDDLELTDNDNAVHPD